MSRKYSQAAANSKTSGSQQQPLTYAQLASSNKPGNALNPAPAATQPPKATSSSTPAAVPAKADKQQQQQQQQRIPANGTNGPPSSNGSNNARDRVNSSSTNRPRTNDPAVSLPSRKSVSSGAAGIQFGSLNQNNRSPSPANAAANRAAAGPATSGGGVPPSAVGKGASKPSFGTVQSHNNDDGKKPVHSHAPGPHGPNDASGRQSHHGRQQNRPGSRSSGHGRQSQNFTPGRKDSYNRHSGTKPKPHDSDADFHGHRRDGSQSGSAPASGNSGAPSSGGAPGSGSQQPPHYPGNPYRSQGHQHMRPPAQGPGGAYKPQMGGPPYQPHHMSAPQGQQMPQPMAYPMSGPGQPPMQGPMMTSQPSMPPMQGWMPPAPGQQYAYMPMQAPAPGYEQYYRPPQTAGGPPMPPNMYPVGNYSMPQPSHAVSSQIGAPGHVPAPMGVAPMPNMTASPMGGQQHHALSSTASPFVPAKRTPVRIVNPNTKKEVDLSTRVRAASSAANSSGPEGTVSPAPAVTDAERLRDSATPADSSAAEEDAKPKFKIPSARAVKISKPSADKEEEAKRKAEEEAKRMAEEEAEAKRKAEEEAEAKRKAEEEAEAKRKAEEEAEAKRKAEEEAEAKRKAEEEAEAARKKAEEEAAAAAAAKAKAEEEAAAAAAAAKAKAEAEAEAKAKAEAEEAARVAAEQEKAAQEAAAAAAAAAARQAAPSTVSVGVETEDAVVPDEDNKEDGEIEDDETDASNPTPLKNRTRQVTFSEPPASAHRTLSKSEVVELYQDQDNAPVLVGEILRYPRVFLERFIDICRPPPSFHFEISNTDDRRSEDRRSGMRRSASGSGRHRDNNQAGGFGGFGQFRSNNPAPKTSDERFRESTMIKNHSSGMSGDRDHGRNSGPMMGGRPPSGQYRGPGGGRESRGGRQGGRGRGRGRGRGGSQHGDRGDRHHGPPQPELPTNFEPLKKSENRYIAKSLRSGKDGEEDENDIEVIDRKIRSLLNKLTLDNFDDVSDDLLKWGNKSAAETDGRILRHLIMLVFQKATDEPTWASMYARLCHKLMTQTNPDVEDHSLMTKEGKFLSGGYLVRKYLLTKCQEDFERGWKVDMPEDLESEEYYEAAKIKRRGLGLVKFIGELFLLDMLTERIMHECVKRLLSNVETPEEEETESLAKLITTVGKKLDRDQAKSYMDAYFQRIDTMAKNKKLNSRIRFMLRDVIDLRAAKWVNRTTADGPKTIAEIHEEAERQKAEQAAMRRAPSHSGRGSGSHAGRTESHRGRRGGWNTVGGPSNSGREQSQRTGDLTGFGNLSRSKQEGARNGPLGANPFSQLAGGSRGWRTNSNDGRRNRGDDRPRSLVLGPGGRTPSHSSRGADSSAAGTPEPVGSRNMFGVLGNDDEEEHMSPRADATKGQPNVEPLSPTVMSKTAPAEDASKPKAMDSKTVQTKVKGMLEEYMNIKDNTELVECFKELGEVNYSSAVYELINYAMDRKADEVDMIARGVTVLCSKDVVSEDLFAAGFAEYSAVIEDIALDAPNAYKFFGTLVAAAQIPLLRFTEVLGELATKTTTLRPPALNISLALLKQIIKADGEDAAKEAVEKAEFDISQFFCDKKRDDASVKSTLNMNDLLPLFPKYA